MQNSMAVLDSLKGILLSLVLLTGVLAYGQTFENPETEAETETETESIESEPVLDSDDVQEPEQEQIVIDASVIEQGDFNPFVPSEDISEDYSVPFPVDI